MKKRLLLIAAIAAIVFSGCVGPQTLSSFTPQQQQAAMKYRQKYMANQKNNMPMMKPTLEYYIDNPILNVEIDLILAEELATMLKMNNLVIDRMPISINDKWPELLRDYQKGLNTKDDKAKEDKDSSDNKKSSIDKKLQKAKDAYDLYLDSLLKRDYSFYKIYDPVALKKQMKSVAGIALITSPSAIKKLILLSIVEAYGKNMEHLKNVISYKPLGCGKKYYNPKFSYMFRKLSHRTCRRIERRLHRRCSFFSKPIEDILYKYEDGFYNLKVGARCFKAVEGRSYPSFRAAFYRLLPNNIRNSIKSIDEKLKYLNIKIIRLKGRLKVAKNAKKKDENKIALLEKKEEKLEKRRDNLKDQREKLFKEAKNRIVVDKNKIKLALKLKTISDYIHGNLTSVGIGTTILGVNTFFDVKDIIKLGANAQKALMMTGAIYMADNKAKNFDEATKMAKKRLKLLLKRTIKLPQNAVAIVYGISTQLSMMSDYRDYIEAVIEAGKKAKYIKG